MKQLVLLFEALYVTTSHPLTELFVLLHLENAPPPLNYAETNQNRFFRQNKEDKMEDT